MSKRMALWIAVIGFLTAWTVLAADATPATLNTLHDLFSKQQGGAVVVSVTGTYPIVDYTYYDYDPETFVVDMADVDVSQLPKSLKVDTGSVGLVKVESISQNKGRALAKLEVHKAYLAKCLVSTEGNTLLIRVVGTAESPEPGQGAKPAASEPPSAAPPAVTSSAKASPASSATKLTGISVADDGSSVVIRGDGTLKCDYFPMKNPDRIVVDLMGISKGNLPNQMSGAGEVNKVRVSLMKEQPPVTRVVLDLKGAVPGWSVRADGADVVVSLKGEAPEKKQVADAQPQEAPAPAPQVGSSAPAPVEMASVPPPEPPAQEQAAAVPPAPKKYVTSTGPAGEINIKPVKENLDKVKVELQPLSSDTKEFKGYEDLFVAQNTAPPAAEGKTIMAGGIPLSFKEKTISGGQVKYTGEPISLSLKDADIKDVLRVFHDISRMNIVVHPSVAGRVTVDLENVPWDQALDIILKNNGLDYIYENNVIWVAPATEIARKFAEQQRLQKEQLEAENLVTFTKRLSYAKAEKMREISSKFISDKASIIVDTRTNTLIIQEVPSKKDGLMKLIDSLDTATPQVVIEARIVETTITWSQSFGVVWSGNWFSGATSTPGVITTTHGGTTSTGPAGIYALHNFDNNQSGWPNFGTGDFAVSVPPSASNGFIDLVLGNVTGSFFLDVRLAAMENTGRGRVLSAPRIVTQDNEKASIESGRQIAVPIATATQTSVIFVNATLKLDVTPQISADGNVNMTVDITNDSVDFADQQGNAPPPIIKKEAKTVLKVRDGATAVIGGIFVTNEGISQNGLPFLSKIPVLGWLFKNRNKSRENDELLIFLTPKIVR